MREKLKRDYKKYLSILLMLCMVLQMPYTDIGVRAEDVEEPSKNEYLELTFADYGIADGTYTNESGTVKGLTNMDGVAFSGEIQFKGNGKSAESYIRVGGTSTARIDYAFGINYWSDCIILRNHLNGGSDELVRISVDNLSVNPLDEPISIRMTFDYENDTDVRVSFSLEGTEYYNGVLSDAMSLIGTYMKIYSTSLSFTVASTIDTTAYDILSFTDMVKKADGAEYESGTLQGASTEVCYVAKESGTLQNTAFEGQFTFSSTGSHNKLFIGGSWKGLRISPTTSNTLLIDYVGDTTKSLGTITATEAGTNLTLTSLNLRVSFAFVNVTDTTADVKVCLQINNAYKRYFNLQECKLEHMQKTVLMYVNNTSSGVACPIIHSDLTPTKLTFTDYGFDEVTTVNYGSVNKAVSSDSYDRVIVEGYYYFSKTTSGSSNSVYLGNGWNGLRIVPNSAGNLEVAYVDTSQSPSTTKLGVIKSSSVGADLVRENIKMKITFAFENVDKETGTADVNIAFVINDDYRIAYTVRGANTSTLNRGLLIYAKDIEHPMTISVRPSLPTHLIEVTPSDFGIADGTYSYEGTKSASGQLNNRYEGTDSVMTMDGKVLSMNLQCTSSVRGYLYIAGDTAEGGYSFRRNNDKFTLSVKQNKLNMSQCDFELEKTGLSAIDEAFNLKLSFEFVDYDGNGAKDDLKLGVWFNDYLYNDTYIYALGDAANLGTYLTIYCDAPNNSGVFGELNVSSEEREVPDYTTAYILEDFGLKNGTYVEKNVEKSMNMTVDNSSITGKVAISGNADLRVYGQKTNAWKGYTFYISSGTLALKHTNTSKDGLVNIPMSFEDVQAGEFFDFTITQEIVDADCDGEEDDVRTGVWVNGEMYKNRYYFMLDFASSVSGTLVIYPNTASLDMDDSVNVEFYNLANVDIEEGYGYLVSGKGALTVNGESVVSGTVLNKTGDYIIRSANAGSYVKQVVLYQSGDAHPDGVVDIRDLVALKKVTQNMSLSMRAGEEGADVDRNGVVDNSDYTSVVEHLLGKVAIMVVKDQYVTYEENVMPIAAYYGPLRITDESTGISYDYLTDDIFQKIQALGINLINYTENNYSNALQRRDILDSLALAEKYDIGVYVKDGRVGSTKNDKQLAGFLSDFVQYSSFKGIAVVDEPDTDVYGRKTDAINLSGYIGQATQLNSYNNTIGYINLHPMNDNLVPEGSEMASAYDSYVNEYLKSSAKLLSWDYYVYDQNTYASTTGYFTNLAYMRTKSQSAGIPFWSYVQAGTRWISNNQIANNRPTKAQLFWNVNTALAYGAKGIQYFTLIQPYYHAKYTVGGSTGYDYDRNGLIGANKEPTKWYWYAQEANRQIATVDEVLMKATSKDVLAIGEQVASDTGLANTTTYNDINITAENGAIIGVFEYQGKTAFYVVNYDTSTVTTSKITLEFNEEKEFNVISEQLSSNETETSGTKCELELVAGGAALVLIN